MFSLAEETRKMVSYYQEAKPAIRKRGESSTNFKDFLMPQLGMVSDLRTLRTFLSNSVSRTCKALKTEVVLLKWELKGDLSFFW